MSTINRMVPVANDTHDERPSTKGLGTLMTTAEER
jgi:hypothetical protein